MMKLKASYERPEELRCLLDHLGPDVKSWRESKNREGQFLKAYIFLNEPRASSEKKL